MLKSRSPPLFTFARAPLNQDLNVLPHSNLDLDLGHKPHVHRHEPDHLHDDGLLDSKRLLQPLNFLLGAEKLDA